MSQHYQHNAKETKALLAKFDNMPVMPFNWPENPPMNEADTLERQRKYMRMRRIEATQAYARRLMEVAKLYGVMVAHAQTDESTDAFLELIEMTGRVTLNHIAAAGDLLAPLTNARRPQPEPNQPDM